MEREKSLSKIYNMIDRLFDNAVDIICRLFGISKEEFLSKKTTHAITDLKKIFILKFYNMKYEDIKINKYLCKRFNCFHTNIIYWHNKAMELYSFDLEFKNNYELFSNELNKILSSNNKVNK